MKPKRDIQNDKADQDAKSDRMEAIDGILRGLESMKRKTSTRAEDFFREFFSEKSIPESE